MKPLQFQDVAAALENIAPSSLLCHSVPKPKIDFLREIVEPASQDNIPSIDDMLLLSEDCESFYKNVSKILTVENITKIELVTHGQSDNENWFMFRKVITGSKGHEVKIKMEKLYKGNGAVVNLWNVFQKISGLTFVNPNIVSLKYGRAMEPNAANSFFDLLSKQHKNKKLIVDYFWTRIYHMLVLVLIESYLVIAVHRQFWR